MTNRRAEKKIEVLITVLLLTCTILWGCVPPSPFPDAEDSTPTDTVTATATAFTGITPNVTTTPIPTVVITREPMTGTGRVCKDKGVPAAYYYVQTVEDKPGFWIQQGEVTKTQYKKCTECSPPRGGNLDDEVQDPVTWITYVQAVEYARWVGNGRLPTEEEWLRACEAFKGSAVVHRISELPQEYTSSESTNTPEAVVVCGPGCSCIPDFELRKDKVGAVVGFRVVMDRCEAKD